LALYRREFSSKLPWLALQKPPGVFYVLTGVNMLIWQHGDFKIVIARDLSYLDPNKTVREVIEEAMKINQDDYKSYCNHLLIKWDENAQIRHPRFVHEGNFQDV
jgi:hypothetical protein